MKFNSGEEFVKSLVSEYCPEPTVSSTIRLETYYKKAHSMFYQALDFVKQDNGPRSYIELMRYCQLAAALASHNNYNQKQYEKDKNLNKRRLNNAIIKLEELKPKLIKDYDIEIEREKAAINKKSESESQSQAQPQEQEAVHPPPPSISAQIEFETEEKEEKRAESKNRWNNLKIASYASGANGQANDKAPKAKSNLDAVFKRPPPALTPIYVTNDLVPGFVERAKLNTSRDIETCAVLTGKYLHDQDAYVVSHVIIPKQKGSANTVQTLNEEELIGVQEKYGVVTLGWIHSHPSQTCFLSSVDMHCQLSYQIMMPNAIAIVYAPTDKTDTFTLSKKGIDILSKCSCQGFHRHENVSGLYQKASHVHIAKHKKCQFVDLRK